ncbi:adenine phosphoribosyltransferase-like [Hydractinia symbiolongicarpus]|uniref:adenine phosphoribosyltransferase-like n=1 Tax=Hydractinia symbiolongicarpus TaxID=13093 RepID=UPI00254CE814|nr:adenine phosphoribosyltransferase-like [Hydractinia symbiolongicarpus]XP_057291014.1 adenine phosphoribosyltransferase-like [Hydractinia symbiolongicarpus]
MAAKMNWNEWEWTSPEKSLEGIKMLIKAVPDFPKKGILFRDIMPIFQVPQAVTAIVDLMTAYIEVHFGEVNAIAGLDARGFLIGPSIAVNLNKPFIPVRKQGKLPGKCYSVESTKEYGKDVLEVQVDGLSKGQKVVIVDDLLATGGTMQSTCQLVTLAGATVAGCISIVELKELNGRSKVDQYPYHAFITY